MRILLVDDDIKVAAGIIGLLERAGFAVDHVCAAESAEESWALARHDLVIVDAGLPYTDSRSLVRRLRRRGMAAPVLVLTSRESLEQQLLGLDLGADDFMVAPFHFAEFLARVRALIRRARPAAPCEMTAGLLCVDLVRRAATARGEPIDLTGREWEILQQLMLACPNVVPKQKMAETLGEWDREVTLNAVEMYVSRLRGKLEGCGVEIRTIRGIGYRLDELPGA
ncbi:MAG TPA: response regulator transcription factor [Rhodocyclaceae bacterium]|nr:response regulator transcription factor [Rhodocyclaceae bacterium]